MKTLANEIVAWLKDYAQKANKTSLVVGVSGGVDSGLVSTLCAMTGLKTICVIMPCYSRYEQELIAKKHISDLMSRFPTVHYRRHELDETYDTLMDYLDEDENLLAKANTKSRLRMVTLYHIATCYNGLVVGTGNKVEDYGVGFFTKYGDGGVDISPIGDLTKTEVRAMAKELGVIEEVVNAIPTDGLWEDGRTDEDQIGATYEELEWAMSTEGQIEHLGNLTDRQKLVLDVYAKWHRATLHKINPIPVFKKNK